MSGVFSSAQVVLCSILLLLILSGQYTEDPVPIGCSAVKSSVHVPVHAEMFPAAVILVMLNEPCSST